MSENYDKLVCGNCGYDGGRAHLKEKLEWEKQLGKLSGLSSDSRQNQQNVIGLTVAVCVIAIAMCVGIVWPEDPVPQPDAETIKYQELRASYEACTRAVMSLDQTLRPIALGECGDMFKDMPKEESDLAGK